jgi:membrane-associated phospholipid phosphatase
MGSWRCQAALGAIALVLGAWVAVGMPWMTLTPAPLRARLLGAAVLGGMGVAMRWRDRRVSDMFLAGFWAMIFGVLYIPAMYAAARGDVVFRDALLARFDASLGVTVPEVRSALARLPDGLAITLAVYRSLVLLLAASVLLPPLAGRVDRTRRQLVATVLAGAIAITWFSRFQAVGPWTVYGFEPDPAQAGYVASLLDAKRLDGFEVDVSVLDGLITFPSFHTVLAVLAAWALRPLPWVGPFAAVWAAAIMVATVGTGWHYVADVVGGVALAALAAACVLGLERAGRAARAA